MPCCQHTGKRETDVSNQLLTQFSSLAH
uniref:Uncharacterized protein n=1 Tax=Anguilla anguilla TaxID=7936 RepID=A0A0E9T4X9_ANGAN